MLENKSIKITLILIIMIVLLIVILLVLNYNGLFANVKFANNVRYESANNKISLNDELFYEKDEQSDEYVIYDKDDNQIERVLNEDELEFYKENSDFNPEFGELSENDIEEIED